MKYSPVFTIQKPQSPDFFYSQKIPQMITNASKLQTLKKNLESKLSQFRVFLYNTVTKEEELKASFSRKKGELPARNDKGSTQEDTSASKLHPR